MITDRDITAQVTQSLTGQADDFDVPAIVDEIRSTYGLVDIGVIDDDEYWALVAQYSL